MRLARLDHAFFDRPTLELAPALLGLELVHETPEGTASGYIAEVEAYRGPFDRAAHSYGGRRTARTEAMFGPPGKAYVYFIYGMHWCLNVVSGPPGHPEAILIRALRPACGIELMRRRRGTEDDRHLADGPGKLCKALGITGAQYGWDLVESPLQLRPGLAVARDQVATGPRIGIGYAGEAAAFPWRFWLR